ncbi:hypothetical protein BDP81DRAFT_158785 [Colletotrichum phormii]|uniref:Uncharacterized protein n=1 Tax=Colletotrichum phormii TaxID=359342 RepID=A0AAJ0EH75_9PEZI|nr:uncharacterized protein BDP81DRAFT_158785 [Colletotrichum phormii]KAK1640132.1 hypothetical protein BDP81DRAFT_158785 [Colletotrichum phormii]
MFFIFFYGVPILLFSICCSMSGRVRVPLLRQFSTGRLFLLLSVPRPPIQSRFFLNFVLLSPALWNNPLLILSRTLDGTPTSSSLSTAKTHHRVFPPPTASSLRPL